MRAIVVTFLLRLPPSLHATLKGQAAENQRSLNAEIVHRLRLSVEGYRR